MQWSKYFKLEILICFNSPITEHWTPLQQTPHIFFPIPLWNWEIFATLEALGGGLQMFFKASPHIFPIPLPNWKIFVILEALGEVLQMLFKLHPISSPYL